MGESGAGKSTLLNIIAGLDRPDSGRVLFEGADLGRMDDDALTRLRRVRIGFIFQAFHILPYLTVLQNVELPLDLLGIPRAQRATRAQAWLDRCGIGALARAYPRELSGNLDAGTAAQILNLLREQLQASAAAAILITHSPAAAAMADRRLRLTGGRLHPETP